jgi:ATP-dependent DNA ligase
MPKRTEVDRRAGKVKSIASVPKSAHPPTWIEPQLTRLAEEAPEGSGWLHEIKYDGYRMHARIDGDKIQLLTRTGLDWSHRYKRTIEALRSLKVKSAYLDGELCALNPDGLPVFSRLRTDGGLLRAVSYQGSERTSLRGRWCGPCPSRRRIRSRPRLILPTQPTAPCQL